MHHVSVLRLPATPASVSAARRHVREQLRMWRVDAQVRDDALLVTSELCTNAIAHTASEHMVCRLRTGEGRLHIEVEDQDPGLTPPAPRTPAADCESGRGLMLVAALSTDWGVTENPRGSGRIVWAELPSPPLPLPTPASDRHQPAHGRHPSPMSLWIDGALCDGLRL